jgi:hypothetical protein
MIGLLKIGPGVIGKNGIFSCGPPSGGVGSIAAAWQCGGGGQLSLGRAGGIRGGQLRRQWWGLTLCIFKGQR